MEPFTLSSDQRTEYRLERQTKERNMDNKEQEEPKDNGECLGAAGSFKVVGSGLPGFTDQSHICKTT